MQRHEIKETGLEDDPLGWGGTGVAEGKVMFRGRLCQSQALLWVMSSWVLTTLTKITT